jgi:hypothetical protein
MLDFWVCIISRSDNFQATDTNNAAELEQLQSNWYIQLSLLGL